jgi:hypothetical protein
MAYAKGNRRNATTCRVGMWPYFMTLHDQSTLGD